MKSARLALALTAGFAAAIAGYFALVTPRPAGKVTDDTSAARPVWAEVTWPFPMDQWGKGRAFSCRAADCGSEVKLYLRAKLGSCNCTTGVADDTDLDRMSDFDLVGGKASRFGAGRSIAIAWMKGRSDRSNLSASPTYAAIARLRSSVSTQGIRQISFSVSSCCPALAGSPRTI